MVGNTGATLAAALTEIGRLKGVMRPPLISTLPKFGGEFCMLDMGANVDCTPDYMVQFAVMGRVFAKRYLKVENPRVGLLNIGEEDSKGNADTKKIFERLQKMKKINFIGNVEPNDMLKSDCVDVVVALLGDVSCCCCCWTSEFVLTTRALPGSLKQNLHQMSISVDLGDVVVGSGVCECSSESLERKGTTV